MRKCFAFVLSLGVLAFTAGSVLAAESAMVVKGKKVKIDYTLTVDGEQVETSSDGQPLEYMHGEGMLITGLEKVLEGMKVGEEKKATIQPAEGYGAPDPKMFREFDKTKFPEGMIPTKGMILEMRDESGNPYPASVSEVKDKSVMLDFNHPLAGKVLVYDVKVISVEDADKKADVSAAAPAAGK